MHVVYGLVGLKTHAKVLLVVRQEADGIRRYCHVGTGNYNPKTARPLRGPRAALGRSRPRRRPHRPLQLPHRLQPPGRRTGSCSSRPSHLRRAIADRIEQQAELGTAGRITLKMNSLVDPAMIDTLYDASQRGRRDRPHRARHLLPAPAGAGPVGDHPRALDRRAVPRALPDLPLRRRSRNRRVPHRFGRPHAPQPRPPGRGARAGHRSAPAGPAGGDARARPRRRHPRVGARRRRHLAQDPDGRRQSPPTARSRSWPSLGRTAPDDGRGEHVTARARAQVHARSVVPPARARRRRRVSAPTHPRPSGCTRRTSTPPTSGSRARARASASATTRAGR